MRRLRYSATGEPRWCGMERLEDRRLFSAGDLDPTFGTGGTTPFGRDASGANLNGAGEHGIDNRNGRTVVAMNGDVVGRFDAAGHYDGTFGQGGTVHVTAFSLINAVAVQADNKVLVGGWLSTPYDSAGDTLAAVARLNANGTIDTGYGVGGVRTFPIASLPNVADIGISADGKAVVVGSPMNIGAQTHFDVARLTAGGQLDTSFGGSGIVEAPISHVSGAAGRAVAIRSDGSILVAGTVTLPSDPNGGSAAAVRITAAGQLDAGFGTGGAFIYGASSAARTLDVGADGRAVVGIDGGGHAPVLIRLSPAGKLDQTFQPVPIASDFSVFRDVRLSTDGRKVVVIGLTQFARPATWYSFAARFDADGTLDHTFGHGNGYVKLPGSTSGGDVQADQKIVLTEEIYNPTNQLFATQLQRLQGADDTQGIVLGADGTLYVEGTTGNDNIYVTAQPAAGGLPDRVRVLSGATVRYFNRSQVKRIVIDGNLGHDRITANAFGIPATLDGGPGNDILSGGAGNDTIRGRAGFDQLLGYGGDDLLDGGDNNDLLSGGTGHDRLYGGNGDDVFETQDGLTDYLDGGPGNNDSARQDAFDAVFAIEQVL